MIVDRRLAEALAIQRVQGSPAAGWTAERIAELAQAGDRNGVERFAVIAARLDDLISASRQ